MTQIDQSLLRLTDSDFPLTIIEHKKMEKGSLFHAHLHENHLQLFYFLQGSAKMYCNQNLYHVKNNDVLLINRNELHYGEMESGILEYYVFRIDLKRLLSFDLPAVNHRYINPIYQDEMKFHNRIENDKIHMLLDHIIDVYQLKQGGYELSLMADLYDLIAGLVGECKNNEYVAQKAELLMKKTKRFQQVLEYIELNYSDHITLDDLARRAHISHEYFCRSFKKCTGRSPMDYVNYIRVEKAVVLLNQGKCNVTEAGMSVGFDDINYFSRVFKKYMDQSPRNYLYNDGEYYI